MRMTSCVGFRELGLPAVPISTARSKRSGCSTSRWRESAPPSELPTRLAFSIPKASSIPMTWRMRIRLQSRMSVGAGSGWELSP